MVWDILGLAQILMTERMFLCVSGWLIVRSDDEALAATA